jgi:hypothetical protein
MTLAQEMAWQQWKKCDSYSGVTLKEIREDGQIWVWHTTGLSAWQQCIRRAREEQARRGVAAIPAAQATEGGAAARGPILAPEWNVGDEWAYRYESPSGSGTFVWAVDRIESLEEQPHYVIRTGTREIFYRVADFGFTRESVEGRVVRQIRPSNWRWVNFPLKVGDSWSMKFHEERPVDRQTEDVARGCRVDAEETVTVPAGTFPTFRVVCRNERNDAWHSTFWYAPEVRQVVRVEFAVIGGKHSRELITYRLR